MLERPVGGIIQRGLGTEAVGTAPGGFRDHRRLAIVMHIHHRMDEQPRLGRVFRLEAQSTAVGIRMAIADGPAGIVPFVIAAKVAVAVDEIPHRVTELFQRTEHFRTGSDPVRGRDRRLESQPT